MLPKSGTIYISEKRPDGSRVTIEVEETPDDITQLPTFSRDPRDGLQQIAQPPAPEPPEEDPFDLPFPFPTGGGNAFPDPWNASNQPKARPTAFQPFGGKNTRKRTFPAPKMAFPKPPRLGSVPNRGFGNPFSGGLGNPFGSGYPPQPQPQRPNFPVGVPIPDPKAEEDMLKQAREAVRTARTADQKPVPDAGSLKPAHAVEFVPENNQITQPDPDTQLQPAGLPWGFPPFPSGFPPFQKAKRTPHQAGTKSGQAGLPPAVTLPPGIPTTQQPVSQPQAPQPGTRESTASTFNVERPYQPKKRNSGSWKRKAGMAMIALSLGGLTGPFMQKARLEASYRVAETKSSVAKLIDPPRLLPQSAPIAFDPMIAPDGTHISPVNTDFAIIIPKIGVNAPVIAGVNPGDPATYNKALKQGVAQSSTSYLPDQNGAVYLFSHSTNYDWFVKDLNAVFYLLKNLQPDDYIVLYYKGIQYTYKLRDKKIVKPNQISYLSPHSGEKTLILETCWPPGSVSERLLLFADLVQSQGQQI